MTASAAALPARTVSGIEDMRFGTVTDTRTNLMEPDRIALRVDASGEARIELRHAQGYMTFSVAQATAARLE